MRRLTPGGLAAGVALLLGGPGDLGAQYTLGLAPVGAPVLAVVDPTVAPGRAINPFREECVARLAVFDADGSLQGVADDQVTRDGIRVHPEGRRGLAARPGWVRISDAGLIQVLLAPGSTSTDYVVSLESATIRRAATDTTIGPLESEPFSLPETERVRCGATPHVSFDIQQPSSGAEGLALDVDIARRGAFARARGGFWEVFAEGVAATSPTAELLDSWKAGGRFEVKLTEGYAHWISLGGVFRFETSEDFEIVDKVLGASVRVRLDFLGLDAFLTPLLADYAPYPMVVLEYNKVTRDGTVPAGVTRGPAVDDRLKGRLDWSVPLLFETTFRMKLQGDLFLGDLPPGVDDRWRPLADMSLEYPLNAAGDVTAVLTRLAGETAPMYRTVAQYLLGIGLRR